MTAAVTADFARAWRLGGRARSRRRALKRQAHRVARTAARRMLRGDWDRDPRGRPVTGWEVC